MLNPCKKCLVYIKCKQECQKFDRFVHLLEKFSQILITMIICLKVVFIIFLIKYKIDQIDESIVLFISWGIISFICNRIVDDKDYGVDDSNFPSYGGKVIGYTVLYLFPESIMISMIIAHMIYKIQKPYFEGGELDIW